MKQKFRSLGRKIGSYPCVSLETPDGIEDCISGLFGELWYAGGRYKAFVGLKSNNEKILTFNIDELEKAISAIGWVWDIQNQVNYANNPNRRFQ